MTDVRLRQLRRFAVSGILVTGLHVLVAAGFIRFIWPVPALANGIAFVTATIFSYLINTLWSFSSPLRGAIFVRFILVSAIGGLLAVVVSGLADWVGMSSWFGIACVVAVVPPLTFLMHTSWTYK